MVPISEDSGSGVRRFAPVAGDQRVVLPVFGVLGVTGLVADDQPAAGVQPGPPEHRVGPEEGQVDPGVPGRGHVGAFGRRPVLVVPGRDQRAGPVQQVRLGGDVHPGHVGQRQAQGLGQHDHVPLVGEEHVRAVQVVRPVQADRQGSRRIRLARADVQVVAAPGVVGLPGRDAGLEHDLARGAGRADRHRHVPLRAGVRVQPEQVRPGRPVVGRYLDDRVPLGPHRIGRAGQSRSVLPVAAQRAGLPDLAGAVSAVPAQPERSYPEPRRRGGDEQRERLPGQHAGRARVAHDRVRRAQVADLPVRVAGQRVLRNQPSARAGPRSRASGRRPGAGAAAPGSGGQGTGRAEAEKCPSAGPMRTAAVPGHGRQDIRPERRARKQEAIPCG